MSFEHDIQRKYLEMTHTRIRAELMYLNSYVSLLLYLPETSHKKIITGYIKILHIYIFKLLKLNESKFKFINVS